MLHTVVATPILTVVFLVPSKEDAVAAVLPAPPSSTRLGYPSLLPHQLPPPIVVVDLVLAAMDINVLCVSSVVLLVILLHGAISASTVIFWALGMMVPTLSGKLQ
jgi:hypothetical protein